MTKTKAGTDSKKPPKGKPSTSKKRRHKGATSLTSPRRIAARRKQEQVLDLRVRGYTLAEIAEQLGYADASGVYHAIQLALQATIQEPADDLRKIQTLRLRRLWRAAWERGDIVQCLRVLEREARLQGLDETVQRHEVQHSFRERSDDDVLAAVIADLEARGYRVVAPK